MLDDLRQQANTSLFEEEADTQEQMDEEEVVTYHRRRGNFLGMTPPQRFVITLLLFTIVSLIGFLALLVTGKVFLPGL